MRSRSTSTAPRWSGYAIRRTISARQERWSTGCWPCAKDSEARTVQKQADATAVSGLFRRAPLCRSLLVAKFLPRQVVALAGAEHRHLVELDDVARDHQIGRVLALGVGLETRASRAVLVGDEHQPFALARVGDRRH